MAFRSGIFASRDLADLRHRDRAGGLLARVLRALVEPGGLQHEAGVGGVLVMNVKLRSSKIVISAGITMPR